MDKALDSSVSMTEQIVDAHGNFALLFSNEMLGLTYLLPLKVQMRSRGSISKLYADEAGPVSPPPKVQPESKKQARRLEGSDVANVYQFELSDFLLFELRRGDENSAPVQDLNFSVLVERKETDELFMKVEFEKP